MFLLRVAARLSLLLVDRYAFWRVMLFTVVATCAATVFGPKTMGRVLGVLYSSTACFIVLQLPLVQLTTNQVAHHLTAEDCALAA